MKQHSIRTRTMPRREIDKDKIIAELRKSNGLVFIAAKNLGCSSKALYNHINRDPDIRDALDETRGLLIDRAEGKLIKKLDAGEVWAIQFILKTLGKSRGFTERQELTGADGLPLMVSTVNLKDMTDVTVSEYLERISGIGLEIARRKSDQSPDQEPD